MRGLKFLSVVFLSQIGCAEPDLLRFASSPILNGQRVAEGEYPEVVLLTADSSEGMAMCTGTLIHPRVVLTAGHCVDFPGIAPKNVVVHFGNEWVGSLAIKAIQLQVHPEYLSDPRRGPQNDIALVRLERPAPADVTPVSPLSAGQAITSADVGGELLYVGFGATSSGSTGVKMWMKAALDRVCTRDGGCYPAAKNTICIQQQPTGICSGDSGGPAFLERGGERFVAGVNSYTFENCEGYGCSTKVDAYGEFIADFVGKPDGEACAEDSACASLACSSGVCCERDCDGRCEACNFQGAVGRCLVVPDGTPCHDSNVCNGDEVCSGGSCKPGEPIVCADTVGCTLDLCDPVRGCVFKPSAINCFDGNPCTDESCDAVAGCVYTPVADGTPCDVGGRRCVQGACTLATEDSCATSGGQGGLALAWLLLFLRYRRPA